MFPAVSIYQSPDLTYPTEKPYHPDVLYPELRDIFRHTYSGKDSNCVYGAVRSALQLLRLDAEHVGQSVWNPLKKYVKPGDKVVLKPNLVTHEIGNLIGANCLTTHGAVIRVMVDYAYLALGGQGELCIADAPVQSARFDVLCEHNGLRSIQEYYRQNLGFDLKIIDLRQIQAVKDDENGFIYEQKRLMGDPKGYAVIDLQDRSSFELPDAGEVDAARFAVADYSLDGTRARHTRGRHEYVVAKTILEADAVIAVPKLKVHEKVGLTVCLKGMVGIVGSKDCLPHYRTGAPSEGGDEYMDHGRALSALWSSTRSRAQGRIPIWLWRILRSAGKRLSTSLLLVQRGFRTTGPEALKKPIVGGAWYGNDTAWRMVADLNYVFRYADANGQLRTEPQRKFFAVVDGVIAGEGNGPLSPSPRALGMVVAGDNAWALDVVCSAAAGLDWRRMRMLTHSIWMAELGSDLRQDGMRIDLRSNSLNYGGWEALRAHAIHLSLPPGWADYHELKPELNTQILCDTGGE